MGGIKALPQEGLMQEAGKRVSEGIATIKRAAHSVGHLAGRCVSAINLKESAPAVAAKAWHGAGAVVSLSIDLTKMVARQIDRAAGHSVKFINTVKGVDQTVKNLSNYFKLVAVLADHYGVDEEVVKTLYGFTAFLKDSRIVTGLLNAPRLVKVVKLNVKNAKILLIGIVSGDQINISRKGDYWTGFAGRTQSYKGIPDKCLGVAYEVSNAVGNVAFIFAFGVCRPILVVMRFYDDMPESVAKVGKAFGLVMLIQNSAKIIASGSDIAHEILVYSRGDVEDPTEAWKQLKNTLARHSFVIIEKGCKITTGASYLAGGAIPPIGIACIEMIGGTFGFIYAWNNTR